MYDESIKPMMGWLTIWALSLNGKKVRGGEGKRVERDSWGDGGGRMKSVELCVHSLVPRLHCSMPLHSREVISHYGNFSTTKNTGQWSLGTRYEWIW